MKRGQLRKTILWVHLALGLTSAVFLVILGATGSALAFRDQYVRWTNPDFFRVKPSGQPMSADELVAKVEVEYAPARVTVINIIWDDGNQYFFLEDRAPVIVNTIDGRVLDPRIGETFTNKLVITAFEWHKRLARGAIGQLIVDIATFEALLLIPTGVVLWWRAKRFSVKWKSSWYRRFWDLHNTFGIAMALPVLFLAFTGALIALRLPEARVPASGPAPSSAPPLSTPPANGAAAVFAPVDAALAAADAELPGIPTFQVELPTSPRRAIAVHKSAGGWSARAQRSTVYVDRYSGAVLRVDRARPYTAAYNAYNLGKRLHTLELFGPVLKALFFAASLLFAVSAFTGIALGIWKLAGIWKRYRSRRSAHAASRTR